MLEGSARRSVYFRREIVGEKENVHGGHQSRRTKDERSSSNATTFV
jgi:hypothetical protein